MRLNSFYQALLIGATLVVDPALLGLGLLAALVEHSATVTYLLGAMVPMLLSRSPSPQERAHTVRIALAPGVPAKSPRRVRGSEPASRFSTAMGSTETQFRHRRASERAEAGHAWARCIEGFEARVVDEDDNELPEAKPVN